MYRASSSAVLGMAFVQMVIYIFLSRCGKDFAEGKASRLTIRERSSNPLSVDNVYVSLGQRLLGGACLNRVQAAAAGCQVR